MPFDFSRDIIEGGQQNRVESNPSALAAKRQRSDGRLVHISELKMAKPDPILEVDIGDNDSKLVFQSHDEIAEFLRRERSFWQTITEVPTSGLQTPAQVRSFIYNELQNLEQQAANFRSQPNFLHGLRDGFKRAFVVHRIPVSTSKIARFLADLKDQGEPLVAVGALAARFGFQPNASDYRLFRGAVEMVAFELGITAKAGKAAQKELGDLSAQYAGALSRHEKEANEILDEMSDAVVEQRKISDTTEARHLRKTQVLTRWTARNVKKHEREFERRISQAIADFKETEKVYQEYMRIKGPVDYWTSKAETHRISAETRKNWLIGYALFSSFIVIYSLIRAALSAPDYITKDTPIFVVGLWGAIGLFISTNLIWAGRVMVRLYLSEHHLALDAEERKTMAMTYLALTNEGKVDEKDRALVLAPLFRPTSDGVVKDDAAPDIGLPGLLSKAVSR